MKIEVKTYPKCECGNDLVPLYDKREFDKSFDTENKIEKYESLFWKCPKCKKIISV